jgi:hypothetical protein
MGHLVRFSHLSWAHLYVCGQLWLSMQLCWSWLGSVMFGCRLTVDSSRMASAETIWVLLYGLSLSMDWLGLIATAVVSFWEGTETLKVSCGLGSEPAHHYFCHILLDKAVLVARMGRSCNVARQDHESRINWDHQCNQCATINKAKFSLTLHTLIISQETKPRYSVDYRTGWLNDSTLLSRTQTLSSVPLSYSQSIGSSSGWLISRSQMTINNNFRNMF